MKFKLGNLTKVEGVAQIPLIIGLLLMAVAIPIATKLSQQSTENRGRATYCSGTCYTAGATNGCVDSTHYCGCPYPNASWTSMGCPAGRVCTGNGSCVVPGATATPVPQNCTGTAPNGSSYNIPYNTAQCVGDYRCSCVTTTGGSASCFRCSYGCANNTCKPAPTATGTPPAQKWYKVSCNTSNGNWSCSQASWGTYSSEYACQTASGCDVPTSTPRPTNTPTCAGLNATGGDSLNCCSLDKCYVSAGMYQCKTTCAASTAAPEPTADPAIRCLKDGNYYHPGDMVCSTAGTYTQCKTDGSWSAYLSCPTGQACSGGACNLIPTSTPTSCAMNTGKPAGCPCLLDSQCASNNCRGIPGLTRVCDPEVLPTPTPECTENSFRCVGDILKTCRDGSWENYLLCSDTTGGHCETINGRAQCAYPGGVCDSSTSKPAGCPCLLDSQCASNNCRGIPGLSRVCDANPPPGVTLSPTPTPGPGSCTTPGYYRCTNKTLTRCSSISGLSGYYWVLQDTCTTTESCVLGDGGRSGECKSTITPTPNLKSCSKTEGEPSCYGKVPGTVCATGRVCVWSGTGQCECALTPTGTPTPTTPTSSCWGVCVVPQSFTCSDFNMVNSTGSCSNGARCCKPVAVTITPTSGAPTATRMPTNPPRQYCYCDGNCGLGDCIWSASATGNYGRRCDDNWCQGIPTATPTPRTFCYCAVNCGIGDCAWLPTASGIYGRRCTVDDCQGIPTPTSGPIATRTPTPTVPYIPNPTAISTPLPTLQPGSACRVDADCGGATKSGCAVQCVTEYCPGNSGCGKTEGTAGALNCQLYPPAGTVWNSNYSACVTSGVVPTGGPPPPPTGGPAPSTCQYQSLQARVQIDSSHDWQTQLTIGSNDSVNLGCMADSTGQLASNVKLVAEYSDGSKQEFNTNLESDWKPSKTGNYTIWCQSTDTTCSGLTSSTNATLKVGGACKECPNDFHCYGPDEDNISLGYAWFATGYVMEGYAAQVPDEYCTDSGLVKPQWIGKGSGDANCDGQINTYDFSLWNKEFDESNGEEVVSSDWEADFTGPEGVCDGIVDTYDFSLWNRSYIELEGGNN